MNIAITMCGRHKIPRHTWINTGNYLRTTAQRDGITISKHTNICAGGQFIPSLFSCSGPFRKKKIESVMLMRKRHRECHFHKSTDSPSLPWALCLGPVVQPTNLWFWPTFWPHPSHWDSWRFISYESHLFLPGRYVIITDLPAPSCWKQAACIWIFHYGTIIR